MRISFILFFSFLIALSACTNKSRMPVADSTPKSDHAGFGKKQSNKQDQPHKDFFHSANGKTKSSKPKNGVRSSSRRKQATTEDAFAAKRESKNYGDQANGKRTRTPRKQKIKAGKLNDGFTASMQTKDYGNMAKGKRASSKNFLGIKTGKKQKIKASKLNDAFTAHIKMKDYGDKSTGKRVKMGKRKEIKAQKLGDAFATSRKYTKDYGEKANGTKPKKKFKRQIRKSKDLGDAFTVKVKQNKKSQYNDAQGIHQKTKKTRKRFHLFRFKSRDQRHRERRENNPLGGNPRFAKKEMKKQKKKKMYGLGIPAH